MRSRPHFMPRISLEEGRMASQRSRLANVFVGSKGYSCAKTNSARFGLVHLLQLDVLNSAAGMMPSANGVGTKQVCDTGRYTVDAVWR